ncbi:peptidase families S8 and S53 domain protein [Methylocaldum marinum]|uniref:Peptidase families S8 and S53 domain protein n=1 Tax=Methylocaldum marinum TaxID=1432792 RepID=A0A250KM36_9GAMM|nr:S8 family serine peptidase [Methylocaldum marinum]BBA32743.1 peptidase families S8 and S53 domain protein [Methylocaldum marinum]
MHANTSRTFLHLLAKRFHVFVLALAPVMADASASEFAAGRILAQPRAGVSDIEFNALLQENGAFSRGTLPHLRIHIVEVAMGTELETAYVLAQNGMVEFAEPDVLAPVGQAAPDDPRYSEQWHLAKIEAPGAWPISSGQTVMVAVLDTGVDSSHPDLASALVPGINTVAGTPDVYDTSDINNHGTAVAGAVAASTGNGIGVASVAWSSRLMPIRVSDRSDGSAYWSDIVNGLILAADHGARVANISYDVGASMAVTHAAQYVRSLGGLVVNAAMNDGIDPGYSDNPYLITVSATDQNDDRPAWSNYGQHIDVAAPGSLIVTTMNGGGYGTWSGTSFSSPIAASVLALIMTANPQLTPDEVETILKRTADQPNFRFEPNLGYGRINAARAVQAAIETQPPDTLAPAVDITSPDAGMLVHGWVSISVSASDNLGVARVVLYAGQIRIGEDTTAPYTFMWDSTLVPDGTQTLTAVAYDASGNEGESSPLMVTVRN